jgi:hypothetical protein
VEDSTIELGNAILLRHRSTYQIRFDDDLIERQRLQPGLAIVQFVNELKSRWMPHKDAGLGEMLELRLSGTRTESSRPRVVTGTRVANHESNVVTHGSAAQPPIQVPATPLNTNTTTDLTVTQSVKNDMLGKADTVLGQNAPHEESRGASGSYEFTELPLHVVQADTRHVLDSPELSASSSGVSAVTVHHPASIAGERSSETHPAVAPAAPLHPLPTAVARGDRRNSTEVTPRTDATDIHQNAPHAQSTPSQLSASPDQQTAPTGPIGVAEPASQRTFAPLTPHVERAVTQQSTSQVAMRDASRESQAENRAPVTIAAPTEPAKAPLVATSEPIFRPEPPAMVEHHPEPFQTSRLRRDELDYTYSNKSHTSAITDSLGAESLPSVAVETGQHDTSSMIVAANAPTVIHPSEMTHLRAAVQQGVLSSPIAAHQASSEAPVNGHSNIKTDPSDSAHLGGFHPDSEEITAQVLRRFVHETELEAERRGVFAWDY